MHIARFVLFAILILLPLGVGEIYVRSLPNPTKSKHAHLMAKSREIEVLILGNSHTYYGINPAILSERAYSAAQVSQTLKYDNWILGAYPFDSLQTVVLPVSDFSLYEELENGDEWYLANRYRLYMNCEIHPCLSVYGWECTAFPVFCEKLKSLWTPSRMQWSSYGQGLEYTFANRRPGGDWDNGEERAKRNYYKDLGNGEKGVAYLESIARKCEKQKAVLVILQTPLRPSYLQHQNPEQVSDTQSRLRTFFKDFPQTRMLDLRADLRFEAKDFYDSDHLNTDGADKLSFILADSLEAWQSESSVQPEN